MSHSPHWFCTFGSDICQVWSCPNQCPCVDCQPASGICHSHRETRPAWPANGPMFGTTPVLRVDSLLPDQLPKRADNCKQHSIGSVIVIIFRIVSWSYNSSKSLATCLDVWHSCQDGFISTNDDNRRTWWICVPNPVMPPMQGRQGDCSRPCVIWDY